MSKVQKLELTWVGKNERENIEPRILIENPELSYTYTKNKNGQMQFADNGGTTDNMLIHGDNLLALKALESKYAGQIKCIYIDPPYNTGSAFENYDDNVEHSIWLNLMRSRLEILKKLLAEEGLIFIQIDDNEQAYLKVLCDEIFGRNNYLNTIIIKAKAGAGASGGGEDKRLKKNYEFILVYVKNYEAVEWYPSLDYVKLSDYIKDHKENNIGFYYTRVITNYGNKTFKGTIRAGSGEDIKIYEYTGFEFSSVSKLAKSEGLSEEEIYAKYFNDIFMVTNAQTSLLTKVNQYVNEKEKLIAYEYVPTTGKSKGNIETKLIWNETLVVWLKDSAKIIDNIIYKTQKVGTLWADISWGRLDLEGNVRFKSGKKPEALLMKIINMSTKEGDLVLDSFLGSGTTCATAHKMNRRWIGIEMGEQAYTHCKTRLDNIIDGTDQTGISKVANWQGGGGYKFYELAPSLVLKDSHGREIINPEYNANMLAAAMALHEGFKYEPSQENAYKQAYSSEKSFMFTTTNHVTAEFLDDIASSFASDEYVIVNCKSFDSNIKNNYKNITIKKIPQSILGKCEFGKDDYSLNIINPPIVEDDDEE